MASHERERKEVVHFPSLPPSLGPEFDRLTEREEEGVSNELNELREEEMPDNSGIRGLIWETLAFLSSTSVVVIVSTALSVRFGITSMGCTSSQKEQGMPPYSSSIAQKPVVSLVVRCQTKRKLR